MGVWVGIPVLYLVMRAVLLAGHFDCLDVEELHYGLLPSQIFDPLLSVFRYQVMAREGGSLLVAPVYAVAQAVVGDSYLGLKCGGLLWNGLTLLVWMGVLWRSVSPRAAATFGLLFAFAPPFFVRMQLVALATHGEVLLWMGIALYCLTLTFDARGRSRRWLASACFGLAAGLSVYFAYSSAVFVVLIVVLALRNRVPILPAAGGLALSLAPWAIGLIGRGDAADLWSHSGGDLFAFLLNESPDAQIFASEGPLERAMAFAGSHQIHKWGYIDMHGRYASGLNWVYSALVASSLLCGVWLQRRSLLGVFRSAGRWTTTSGQVWLLGLLLVYGAVFPLAVVASGIDIDPSFFDGFRYQLSGILAVLLLTALSMQKLRLRWSIPLLAGLLGLGVWGISELRTPEFYPTPLAHYYGYNRFHVEEYIARLPVGERVEAIEDRVQDRVELIHLHGYGTALSHPPTSGALAQELPVDWRPLYWEGACRGWQGDGVSTDWIVEVVDPTCSSAVSETCDACLRGVGRAQVHVAGPIDIQSTRLLLEGIADGERQLVLEGCGIEDLRTGTLRTGLLLDASLSQLDRESYCRGLGRQLARQVWPPWSPPDRVLLSWRLTDVVAMVACGEDSFWSGYQSELESLESAGVYR